MKIDPTTESIAHFIGLFELKVEELRLRQDYLEFRLKQPLPEETPPVDVIGVRLQAPYELRPYDPGLDYQPAATALVPVPPAHLATLHQIEIPPVPTLPADEFPKLHDPGSSQILPWGFLLPPPMSVVTITLQSATLFDDDLMLNGLGVSFVAPGALHAILSATAGTAETLVGFDLPDLPQAGGWITFASDMLVQMDEAEAPVGGSAQAWLFRAEEAHSVIVDGAVVEEAPVWSDLLPLYLRPEDDAAEPDNPDEHDDPAANPEQAATDGGVVSSRTEGAGGEAVSAVVPEHDFSRDFDGHTPGSHALEPGHEVVAGANTAINEIKLASQWLDAPVIVVGGDVVRVDAISQVNVLVEHDTIDGIAMDQPSLAMNVAEISTVSSQDPDLPETDDVLPQAWQVVRVEADVVQVNWVKQFTFATDFDRAEVVFSGNATFLGFGDNQIVNAAILNEIGYGYDLIFVAGDMIDATVISQKNTLFDSDRITTTGGAAGTAASADPTIVAGSDEAVEAGSPDPLPEQQETASATSLADNLLLNQATLESTGIDTFVRMTESFAAAAEALAEGAETISREVAQDAMFAGREALRVLQIDGDLTKINLFDQTNIVGDADQVHLAMESLRDRLEAEEAKLIAGSNALVNLASVIEYGVDSTIMAAGQVYDDALIYQAELIDTDAVPTGVALSGLANEAVAAFLADGMLDPEPLGDDIVPTGSPEAPAHVDVMQTALA